MTVSNANLELDHTSPSVIRSSVSYTVVFTPLERHLAALGMRYREEISILESDIGEVLVPPGGSAPPPAVLATYPNRILSVSDGDTDLTLNFTRNRNNPHAPFHAEDPAGMNPDEAVARVTVRPIGFAVGAGSSDASSVEIVPTLP